MLLAAIDIYEDMVNTVANYILGAVITFGLVSYSCVSAASYLLT